MIRRSRRQPLSLVSKGAFSIRKFAQPLSLFRCLPYSLFVLTFNSWQLPESLPVFWIPSGGKPPYRHFYAPFLLRVPKVGSSLFGLEADTDNTTTVVGRELPSLQQITITLPASGFMTVRCRERLVGFHIVLPKIFVVDDSLLLDLTQQTQLIRTIRLFTNVRTLNLHRIIYHRDDLREDLKQALLNLSPRDRQNLKEVIFTGYSHPAGKTTEEKFTLPPF
jgi:hypothetical protein